MAMWNRCAICGRAIPVGELCYGVKNWHGEPTNGDTICSDCLVPENAPTLTPQNETPPCYQPDGDGCAYQCHDGDDEPIDKCKECPLCYSDKQRHITPQNEPLTIERLREMDGEPVWVEEVEHWALIDVEKGGQWDSMPFAVWAENGAKFTYNIMNRNLHCYRCPPDRQEGTDA